MYDKRKGCDNMTDILAGAFLGTSFGFALNGLLYIAVGSAMKEKCIKRTGLGYLITTPILLGLGAFMLAI